MSKEKLKEISAADAMAFLMTYARTAPVEVVEAVGAVHDHVARLEQVLQLIAMGVESALRDKPENAVIDLGKRRIEKPVRK